MRDDLPRRLLGPDDPDPVAIVNREARSPFLLIGDHAGDAIPSSLGTLGLGTADLSRHITLDIGTRALGYTLAGMLDATFIHQRYSRLVIDCNRDPSRDDSMPSTSDGTAIPGNINLNDTGKRARASEIHAPYHAAVAAEVARRSGRRHAVFLISLHSFTPRLAGGSDRPWQVGVLHDGRNDGFARRLLKALPQHGVVAVGDNEPYQMDATDYSIPNHAFASAIPYAELEVRQDLISDDAGVAEWAARLGPSFLLAAASAAVRASSARARSHDTSCLFV